MNEFINLDPDCPTNPLEKINDDDPMNEACGCFDEILSGLRRKHYSVCKRCRRYAFGGN